MNKEESFVLREFESSQKSLVDEHEDRLCWIIAECCVGEVYLKIFHCFLHLCKSKV